MKPYVRKLAWILGGVSVITGSSIFAVACSTDNGTNPDNTPVPGVDSGRRDSSTTTDGSVTPGPDGSVPTDGSTGTPDCGFAPKLRSTSPPDAGADSGTSFFCPFGDGGTSGTDKRFCAGDQTCCTGTGSGGTFDTSYCTATKAEVCPAGAKGARSRWECGGPDNCSSGQKCCIPGTDGGPPAVDTEKVNGQTCPPEFQRGFFIGGTLCRSACQSGEIEVCTKDSECSGGKKCVAFSTNNRDLGACK